MRTIVFLLFIALCSCNCEKLYLTQDELSWISSIHQGESYFYNSSNGDIDTLFVSEVRQFHTDCNFEVSNYQSEVKRLTLIFLDEKFAEREISVFLTKDEPSETARPLFKILNLEFGPSDDLNKIHVIDTVFNGITYSSIYCFKKDAQVESFGQEDIEEFYWSKEKGLVAYKTFENKFFSRCCE